MDIFIEQLVIKQKDNSDRLKEMGIIFLSVFIFVFAFMASRMFRSFSVLLLAVAVGALFGGFYLLKKINIEFEYIFTNGELDIDKIIARSSRKNLVNVNVKSFEKFGIYSLKKREQFKNEQFKKIFAGDSLKNNDLYYATFNMKNQRGRCLLIFTPDEKVLSQIKKYLPRNFNYDI